MSSAHDDHHDHGDAGDGPVVLAVSDRHPRVRTIQVHRPADQDTTFLAASTKGIGITLKHFAKNLFGRRRKIELQPELLRFGKTFPAGSSESARLYDALLRLAAADGRVRPREKQFLEELTLALGYTRQTLEGRLRDLGHASSP